MQNKWPYLSGLCAHHKKNDKNKCASHCWGEEDGGVTTTRLTFLTIVCHWLPTHFVTSSWNRSTQAAPMSLFLIRMGSHNRISLSRTIPQYQRAESKSNMPEPSELGKMTENRAAGKQALKRLHHKSFDSTGGLQCSHCASCTYLQF